MSRRDLKRSDGTGSVVPLAGVIGIVQCADKSCLLLNTNAGLSADSNGNATQYDGFGLLRVDDSLRGQPYTYVTIHEFVHIYCPRWDEATVSEFSAQLNDLLYLPMVRQNGALDV